MNIYTEGASMSKLQKQDGKLKYCFMLRQEKLCQQM